MSKIIDATKDTRFALQVEGTHFRLGPVTIDITKIDEQQALRLAADPKCKFLHLAKAEKGPAAPAQPASSGNK